MTDKVARAWKRIRAIVAEVNNNKQQQQQQTNKKHSERLILSQTGIYFRARTTNVWLLSAVFNFFLLSFVYSVSFEHSDWF